jgi:hypothetical protein
MQNLEKVAFGCTKVSNLFGGAVETLQVLRRIGRHSAAVERR